MRLFLFGAGYSARSLAQEMENRAGWIGGTARSDEKLADLKHLGIEPFRFAGSAEEAAALPLEEVTHLVVSIAPDGEGDPTLRAAGDIIRERMPSLEWIGYFSTIGVYGDAEGGWIDETAPLSSDKGRGRQRIAAEQQWIELGREKNIPVAILRLAGIYGPGRNQFVKLREGRARRIVKPGQVFNRIHAGDIAGATAHLMARGAEGSWNITDDEPAPPQDVLEHAAALMGVEPPPVMDFDRAELPPMVRSFYADNKRVSNAKLKASGYRMRFPEYRMALGQMWERDEWRGRGERDAPRLMR